jgi:hypothetical protein
MFPNAATDLVGSRWGRERLPDGVQHLLARNRLSNAEPVGARPALPVRRAAVVLVRRAAAELRERAAFRAAEQADARRRPTAYLLSSPSRAAAQVLLEQLA